MSVIKRTALVSYTPAMMFSLVDDVESYPAFLPWCNGARVLERNDDEVKASIDISKGALRKTFTTCNRRQKNKMIEMRLVEGPFKKLEGFWRFDSVGDDGCKVSLDLQFEFSNPLMRATIGPVFSQIANTLVDSFCRRAEAVYGT